MIQRGSRPGVPTAKSTSTQFSHTTHRRNCCSEQRLRHSKPHPSAMVDEANSALLKLILAVGQSRETDPGHRGFITISFWARRLIEVRFTTRRQSVEADGTARLQCPGDERTGTERRRVRNAGSPTANSASTDFSSGSSRGALNVIAKTPNAPCDGLSAKPDSSAAVVLSTADNRSCHGGRVTWRRN